MIVQFEIYDLGFEITRSSDFEIPDFLIPDLQILFSPISNTLQSRGSQAPILDL